MVDYNPEIYSRWVEEERPVGGLLPGEANGSLSYSEGVDWLTAPIDKELSSLLKLLKLYPNIFNPNVCEEKWLDFIAPCCGFVEDYWDTKWTASQKRWMLLNSYKFIWSYRGTEDVLKAVLNNFNLLYDIWKDGGAIIPFTIGDALIGLRKMRFFVRLPLKIFRNSPQWRLAETLTRQYSAVGVEKKVCYEQFYIGFSIVGDPTFPSNRAVLTYDSEGTFNPNTLREGLVEGAPIMNDAGSTITM